MAARRRLPWSLLAGLGVLAVSACYLNGAQPERPFLRAADSHEVAPGAAPVAAIPQAPMARAAIPVVADPRPRAVTAAKTASPAARANAPASTPASGLTTQPLP